MARSTPMPSLLVVALLASCSLAIVSAKGGSDDASSSSSSGRHSGNDDVGSYYASPSPSPHYSPKVEDKHYSPSPSPKPKPNCGNYYCNKYQKCMTSSYKYKVCVDIKKEILCVDRTCKLKKEKCGVEQYKDKKSGKWVYNGKCKHVEGW